MTLRILATAAAVLLAACSSSKKSSTPAAAHDVSYTGPTGAVTIASAGQAATVASGAYASMNGVSGVGNFTSVMGVSGAPAFTASDAARLAARAGVKLGAAQLTGASQSGSDKCDYGGTISGTMNAADLNYPFTHTGDNATITFSLCNMSGSEVMDGTISIRIDSTVAGQDFLGGSPGSLTAGGTYAATLTFGDLTIMSTSGNGWTGMDGNITMSVTKRVTPNFELEESISGTGLAYAVGQGSQILEGSLLTGPNGNDTYLQKLVTRYNDSGFYNEYGEFATINGKMCSTEMGGCLTVVTVTPVFDAYGASHPSAGYLVMRSGNAQLIFDVLSVTSVDIGFDTNVTDNAGTDPTPLTTIHATWTCLEANNCPTN